MTDTECVDRDTIDYIDNNECEKPQNSLMQSIAYPCAPIADWELLDKDNYCYPENPKQHWFRNLIPSKTNQIDVLIDQTKRTKKFLKNHPKTAIALAATFGTAAGCASQLMFTGSLIYCCLPKITINNNYYTTTAESEKRFI